MLSPVPQDGLLFEELRTLLAKGRMIAFAIDAVGRSCALMLISMLLAPTTTYRVVLSALVLAMSKFMAFETAHWKRDVWSHWYRKVASSQTWRKLWTIESQDVSLLHMNASGVNDVREFLLKLLFRENLKVAMLD